MDGLSCLSYMSVRAGTAEHVVSHLSQMLPKSENVFQMPACLKSPKHPNHPVQEILKHVHHKCLTKQNHAHAVSMVPMSQKGR